MKKILFLSMLLSLKTFAQETTLTKSEEVSQVLNTNTYEPNYFTMILGLFVVVGLIYLTGFFYQKLTKVNLKYSDYYINKAQIISTTSLGQGRNLHVVKFGKETMLIGATQNNITFIKDVELVSKEDETKNDKNS